VQSLYFETFAKKGTGLDGILFENSSYIKNK